jgi:hypothetical protein
MFGQSKDVFDLEAGLGAQSVKLSETSLNA